MLDKSMQTGAISPGKRSNAPAGFIGKDGDARLIRHHLRLRGRDAIRYCQLQ
jgi:hypothetical protein